jgi:hypothetical protein
MSSSAADVIATLPYIDALADNRGLIFAIAGAILALSGFITLSPHVRRHRKLQLWGLTVNGLSTTVYAVGFVLAYLPVIKAPA